MFRRGSILLWEEQKDAATPSKKNMNVEVVHEDMLKDIWWTETRPSILK